MGSVSVPGDKDMLHKRRERERQFILRVALIIAKQHPFFHQDLDLGLVGHVDHLCPGLEGTQQIFRHFHADEAGSAPAVG